MRMSHKQLVDKPGMAGGEERKVRGMPGRRTGEMRQECRACGKELVRKRSARTTGQPPASRGKQDNPLGMRMTVAELVVLAHRLPAVCKPRTMAEHIGQLALTFLRPEASRLDVPSDVQTQAKRTWRFHVIDAEK